MICRLRQVPAGLSSLPSPAPKPDERSGSKETSLAPSADLRGRLAPIWSLHLGGRIELSEASRIAGIGQHHTAGDTPIPVGVTWFLPGQHQLLRLGWDLAGADGFAQSQ